MFMALSMAENLTVNIFLSFTHAHGTFSPVLRGHCTLCHRAEREGEGGGGGGRGEKFIIYYQGVRASRMLVCIPFQTFLPPPQEIFKSQVPPFYWEIFKSEVIFFCVLITFRYFSHYNQTGLKFPQVFQLLSQHYDCVSDGGHARGSQLHLGETLATLGTKSLGGMEGEGI